MAVHTRVGKQRVREVMATHISLIIRSLRRAKSINDKMVNKMDNSKDRWMGGQDNGLTGIESIREHGVRW